MLLNFTWWVNRKDALGKNIFQGGFLGMDNIGAFDRGKLPPGYPQVAAIEQWLRDEMKYVSGSSNASTSAVDTAKARTGVCRDYAHLGIALARSLNIPARMVVGYLHNLEPMDLHAWFEAYVGDRWYTFDATQAEPRGGRVVLAYGRDAADVAFISNYGPLETVAMRVWVEIAPPPLPLPPAPPPLAAPP